MPANGRPAFRPSGESRQHTAAAGAAGETFARLPARRDGRNSVWNLAPGDVGQADADARTFLHLARPKPAPRAPRTLAQAKLDRAIADQIAEAAAAPVAASLAGSSCAHAWRDVRRRGAAAASARQQRADRRRRAAAPRLRALGKRPTGDTKWLVVGGGRREPPSILVVESDVYAASFADRMLLKLALVASRRASGYPAGDDDPVARTSQLVVGVDGSVRQAAWDFSGFLRLPRLAASDLGPRTAATTTHRVDGLAKAQSGLLALERATGVVDNDAIVTVDTEAGALEIIYVTSRRDVVGLSSAPLPDDVEDERAAPGGAQRLDRKVRVAAPNFGYWSTSDGLCAVWLDSLRGPATERTVSTKAGPTTTTTLARYGRGSETGFEPLPASLQEIRDGKGENVDRGRRTSVLDFNLTFK
ncbi:hypothetical protein JL720_14853 [Aureococcus anophagefferens]|nr:hypothetical protein JL720_14853 [Aureococcus anophagefferens]